MTAWSLNTTGTSRATFPIVFLREWYITSKNNQVLDMEYFYNDGNYVIDLLDKNYRNCNWDWIWYLEDDVRSRKRAAVSSDEQKQTAMLDTVKLIWSKNDDIITMEVRVPTSKPTWIGLAWGGEDDKMTNADMVIASKENDDWVVKDYFSYGYEKPEVDESQDITDTSAGYDDGESWMKFSRKIKTDDKKHDRRIKAGSFEIAYAVGYSTKLSTHKFAGHEAVTLFEEEDHHNDDDDDDDQNYPNTFLEYDFYNREWGHCLPNEQKAYEKVRGHCGNFQVQNAKKNHRQILQEKTPQQLQHFFQ